MSNSFISLFPDMDGPRSPCLCIILPAVSIWNVLPHCRGPWTLWSIEIDKRPDEKCRLGSTGACDETRGSKTRNWSLAYSLKAGPLNKVRVTAGPGAAGVVCPPPGWCCGQGSCAVPCFCSGYLRRGSSVSGLLYLVPTLPQQLHSCSYFSLL